MPNVLDLNAQVKKLRARFGALLDRDVELSVSLDPALWRVRASEDEIDDMLANLVASSGDLLVSGGRVTVSTSNYESSGSGDCRGCPEGRFVRFSVAHTGYMTEEVARALEAKKLTRGRQGPESALAAIYGTAQRLGGYVWFRSVQKDGTYIEIFFPATQELTDAERAFSEREALRSVEEELNGNGNRLPN